MSTKIVAEIIQFSPVENVTVDAVALGFNWMSNEYVVTNVSHAGDEFNEKVHTSLKDALMDMALRVDTTSAWSVQH